MKISQKLIRSNLFKHSTYLVLLSGLASFPLHAISDGENVANKLNAQYIDQPESCTDVSGVEKPGYYCSGVILRSKPREDPWSYSAAEAKRGSVAFSYTRADIDVPPDYERDYSGITFAPLSEAIAKNQPYSVACMFPMGVLLDSRKDLGCGAWIGNADSGACSELDISTAEQWVALYRDEKVQCSFDGEDSNAFIENIAAQNILFASSDNPDSKWHKSARFVVPVWDMEKPELLPITSIWYTAWEGDFTNIMSQEFLVDAHYQQTQYLNKTGIKLPILRLTGDKSAPFIYVEEDQVK
jgi:hypothetical protein